MSSDNISLGEAQRRAVMGDEFVDRALAKSNAFDRPLQDLATENAWGGTWAKDDLPLATRSLITISMLVALRASAELKGHIRGAIRNGVQPEEIRAVILHATNYCGFPAAMEAMRIARQVLESEGV